MAGEAEFYAGRIISRAKRLVKGLYARRGAGAGFVAPDSCPVNATTGTTSLPDILPVAGTYTIFAPGEFPANMDVNGVYLDVKGATSWSGGTGTTKTLIVQDSAGGEICSFTQAALTGNTQYSLPVVNGGALPTGVSDTMVKLLGITVASGLGLQVVVANTPSAGSPVRLRIVGELL